MSLEITMPALSPTMETGLLVAWRIAEGDAFRAGDVIAEIETDKAVLDLEAAQDGVLDKILTPAGGPEVAVGTVVATLRGDAVAAAKTPATPPPASAAAPASAPIAPQPLQPAPARPKASPLARRIALARGVDLAALTGSGPGGRIVRRDVEAAIPATAPVAEAPPIAPSPPSPVTPTPAAPAPTPAPDAAPVRVGEATQVPLSGVRRTIAERMALSKAQAPHAYLSIDLKLDALKAARERLQAVIGPEPKLSLNDCFLKAMALALSQTPAANVQFAGDHLLQFSRVDLAVAVATPRGLITPVIDGADRLPLSQLALQAKDLIERARLGQLRPEEFQGGVATLSNLGMHGINRFAAILNPPQALILAIGTAERRFMETQEGGAFATVCTATASFDHRAMDGTDCAAFLTRLKTLIEEPLLMLV